jgi:CRISPR/Cas system-associated exonuclease Cas4 (RecB family)
MPSNRGKIFMNKYFAQLSKDEPIWSPQYTNTIDLLTEISGGQNKGDDQIQRMTLIWELWNAYEEKVKSGESFDDFFSFGDILLNDFDEIDKEMKNAKGIFANVAQLNKMGEPDYLLPEQIEAAERFFNFKYEKSELKTKTRAIWNKLYEVYIAFNENLEKKNIAYDGMLMRKAVENLSDYSDKFTKEAYIFVGFYKFFNVEIELIKFLKEKRNTLFYWDFDEYYIESPACENIKKYREKFGGELNKIPKNFAEEKSISFVESAGNTLQTGFVQRWLKSIENKNFEDANSAIVLCDTGLLPVVLNALPKDIEPNIAILYPLRQTLIANLIVLLLDLQTKGVHGDDFDFSYLQPILRSYYIAKIYENAVSDEKTIKNAKRILLKQNAKLSFDGKNETVLTDKDIFSTTNTSKELLAYLQSILTKISDKNALEKTIEIIAFSQITKMLTNAGQICEKIKGVQNFAKIIKKLLFSMKVPYRGEPAKGLQIMAMSDTRNMDFENILMLSVNEGIMPEIKTENSFIPQFLRKYFKLDNVDEQNWREFYNFYRLLQRAENISFSYNTGSDGIGKGEMSRYLRQLSSFLPHKIKRIVIDGNVQNEINSNEIKIIKTDEILKGLKKKYDGEKCGDKHRNSLSPSAFNTYIDCPLQFYFKYAAKIKKPDDEELNNAVLGNIFHKTMELIYKDNYEKKIEITDDFFNNIEYEQKIVNAFNYEFFKTQTPPIKSEYSGEHLIIFRVISQMVKNTLAYDKKYAPFKILGLEKECSFEKKGITIGGIIDRIDEKDGNIRVIDYKTGKIFTENDFAKDTADIFSPDRPEKAKYQFQAYLYSYVLSQEDFVNASRISPNLIFVLQREIEEKKLKDFSEIKEEFDKLFTEKLEELFNADIPFVQCEKKDNCKYCDYCDICEF